MNANLREEHGGPCCSEHCCPGFVSFPTTQGRATGHVHHILKILTDEMYRERRLHSLTDSACFRVKGQLLIASTPPQNSLKELFKIICLEIFIDYANLDSFLRQDDDNKMSRKIVEALRTILRLLLSRGVKAEVEKSLLPTKFRFSIFPDALADKLSHGNTMQVALPGPGEGHRDCEWFGRRNAHADDQLHNYESAEPRPFLRQLSLLRAMFDSKPNLYFAKLQPAQTVPYCVTNMS
ncbi:hypothetical protein FIBSPDRAFT_883736 [Athelia psychrophila]|uniref:SNF2 N-terminal domain-containing protein n=1 Tax=Athelia psychrophila TaxID=1759441 RepID=A0A166TVX5_9AGAM|nr:hypothetical protein FIBSPDRAFT_883736 [Fibularhizoctonia sp. CBS 109695]